MIAFSTMALLIELRRPGNRVARVMAAAGALLVITFLGFAVGAWRYVLYGAHDLVGGPFAVMGGALIGPPRARRREPQRNRRQGRPRSSPPGARACPTPRRSSAPTIGQAVSAMKRPNSTGTTSDGTSRRASDEHEHERAKCSVARQQTAGDHGDVIALEARVGDVDGGADQPAGRGALPS